MLQIQEVGEFCSRLWEATKAGPTQYRPKKETNFSSVQAMEHKEQGN